MSDLIPRIALLSVWFSGLSHVAITATAQEQKTETEVSFVYSGRVMLPDGSRPEQLSIQVIYSKNNKADSKFEESLFAWVGEELHREMVTTDEQGEYRVEVPSEFDSEKVLMTVTIDSPGYLTRTIGPFPAETLDNARVNPRGPLIEMYRRPLFQIVLKQGFPYRGRAELPTGEPAVGAIIRTQGRRLDRTSTFGNPNDYATNSTTTVDQNGNFELLIDRKANLSISLHSYGPFLTGRLEDHNPDDSFRLLEPINASGQVVDHDGDPVPFAIVRMDRYEKWDANSNPPSVKLSGLLTSRESFGFGIFSPGTYWIKTTHRIGDSMEARGKDPESPETWRGLAIEGMEKTFLVQRQIYSLEDPRPEIELRALQTYTLKVKVDVPNTMNSPVGLSASGLVGDIRWFGHEELISESSTVEFQVPRELTEGKLRTGVAYLKVGPDAETTIGDSFEFGSLGKDRSGIEVTIPQFATLAVRANHDDRQVVGSVGIDVVYLDDDFPDDQVVTSDMLDHLTASDRVSCGIGKGGFCSGPVIANQKIAVLIRNKANLILHQRVMTLEPDAKKSVVFDLARPNEK